MAESFDFIVVGGGSAGAVVASRLSEDPTCRVALIEAGDRPPMLSSIPIACGRLQLDPSTDWMYDADPGKAGLGLKNGRMPVPRGKMLGGSSALNYMAYVRGHPGDFDAWAEQGAAGWSYEDVLPYFRKSEGLKADGEVVIDREAHNTEGPLGVSVRSPVLRGAKEFVAAAEAAGIPRGDYNARDRGGPTGVASLFQTTTRAGKRSSAYHAFLEGAPESRPNLTIIAGAQATRLLLENASGGWIVRGVDYRVSSGETVTARADKEVIVCAGAVGTPHLLMLSGVGPRQELMAAGVACLFDQPHVGKHLKDHLHCLLYFPAQGVGVPLTEIGVSLGPDFLRAPLGPLPANPDDDDKMPAELQGLKQEAERRIGEWATTGHGIISSSLYDAVVFTSTGLGDAHTHDAEIACFVSAGGDLMERNLNVDPSMFFDDPAKRLGPEAEAVYILANPVQPHSEGEIVLASGEPAIRMNYFADPHDLKVMVAVIRRALNIAEQWPGNRKIGPLHVPPHLAKKHGHEPGAEPSDALLEDMARHYSITVYHLTSTCRIGEVVDPRLRFKGIAGLRIADASVMPNVISGNTNAPCIMIGEKAAEMIAAEHGVKLADFVGERPN